jgi:anti-sigma factor RsiW
MINLWKRDVHPADEELLLVADRECSPRRTARVREHLGQCAPCQARMTELETALADFVSFHEQAVVAQSPADIGMRDSLKAKLSEAARDPNEVQSQSRSAPWMRQFAGACIALLIVGSSLWVMRGIMLQKLDLTASDELASALPRRRLTPGAIKAIRMDELCRQGDLSDDPPVNISLEQRVLAEYGVPVAARHGYQLDYLITPELGGSDDIRNLWPEPYSSTSWNAHVKDALEDHLHDMVCQGKLPLATAQEEIATDWIAAYKREFHTETPLTDAATLGSPAHRDGRQFSRELATLTIPVL